ncbi:MAG: hypothetical protein ACYCU5_06855 [Actinomycetes bacterium]
MNDTTQERQDPTVGPGSHDAEGQAPRQADAAEVPELARHGDPSQATRKATAARQAAEEATGQRRGVVWMRPSELMGHATARVAGRGIDFHAELARRARRPAVQAVAASRRAISERARRLPPVSAFGRRGHSPAGATRSGIGLS